jgi:hypothetical protein
MKQPKNTSHTKWDKYSKQVDLADSSHEGTIHTYKITVQIIKQRALSKDSIIRPVLI